ncbi:MAG: glycosyltransferase [Porphyrobacter sp. IPPAS B-1204]|nr:MAG: glycosyltransferase [Porphyrobacter sp. IPPAS B-1204]
MTRTVGVGIGVLVHLEAFWRFPVEYLTATKWRLLRKRVRARAQFAVLIGRTSRAYDWWSIKNSRDFSKRSEPGPPPIMALVIGRSDDPSFAATLASLTAEGIDVCVVGSSPVQALLELARNTEEGQRLWVMPVYCGDQIACGAAAAYRAAIQKGSDLVVYADDDLVGRHGFRSKPHFKPDWNGELFLHHDFVTGACILAVDRKMLEVAAGEQDWPLCLARQALSESDGATHIREVLHHRRDRPPPRLTLPALSFAADSPRVSLIIPTRNRLDLLAKCIAGVMAAHYPDFEAIVVDNESDDPATLDFLASLPRQSQPGRTYRVLHHPGPFNYSAINNRAVAEATGELICLLNNDIEMIDAEWLRIMASQALRDEVGAVGAQLLYPDGRLQHAGVVIGVGNAAGHAHRFLRPEEEGYHYRHALPQFVSAVTAACLVVKRDRFLVVGGLDETHFPVAFNDVDLCLRLNERGWQSLYEPRAVLIHHESVSRGLDTDPVGAARFAKELAALQNRWRTDQIVDPFHHPQLSRASEQFVLAL